MRIKQQRLRDKKAIAEAQELEESRMLTQREKTTIQSLCETQFFQSPTVEDLALHRQQQSLDLGSESVRSIKEQEYSRPIWKVADKDFKKVSAFIAIKMKKILSFKNIKAATKQTRTVSFDDPKEVNVVKVAETQKPKRVFVPWRQAEKKKQTRTQQALSTWRNMDEDTKDTTLDVVSVSVGLVFGIATYLCMRQY